MLHHDWNNWNIKIWNDCQKEKGQYKKVPMVVEPINQSFNNKETRNESLQHYWQMRTFIRVKTMISYKIHKWIPLLKPNILNHHQVKFNWNSIKSIIIQLKHSVKASTTTKTRARRKSSIFTYYSSNTKLNTKTKIHY